MAPGNETGGDHLLVDDELGLGDALMKALQAFDPPAQAPKPAAPVPPAVLAAVAPALAPSPAQEKELAVTRARLERANSHIEDLKRQAERSRDHTTRFGNEPLLKALLPSVDNLERAIDAASRGSADQRALLDGVRMVHRQLVRDLEAFGLTTFESIGAPFDPARHEAVQQVASDRYASGVVVAEFSRGYMLHDRLLRPARVAVCSGARTEARPEPPAQAAPATPPTRRPDPEADDLLFDLD